MRRLRVYSYSALTVSVILGIITICLWTAGYYVTLGQVKYYSNSPGICTVLNYTIQNKTCSYQSCSLIGTIQICTDIDYQCFSADPVPFTLQIPKNSSKILTSYNLGTFEESNLLISTINSYNNTNCWYHLITSKVNATEINTQINATEINTQINATEINATEINATSITANIVFQKPNPEPLFIAGIIFGVVFGVSLMPAIALQFEIQTERYKCSPPTPPMR